jgi:murein tripeptide amidase MpaA
MYRYEGNLMVVYDSNSRLRDEPISLKSDGSLPVRDLTPSELQELECVAPYDRNKFLCSPRYPPHKYHNPQYTLQIPPDCLRFDSKFEGGNLGKVWKVTDNEYNLQLSLDIQTKGQTQWYYFAVKSFKSNHTVRFNITNLHKYESLYNEGLQPCIYSTTKFKKTGVKWHRGGTSIAYFQNSTLRQRTEDKESYYYTLTFTYSFEYASDTVSFAHCFPYSYSELLGDLDKYKAHEDILRVDSLCHSLAGNWLPALTITKDIDSYTTWETELKLMGKTKAGRLIERNRETRRTANERPAEFNYNRGTKNRALHRNKKGVVLTARVHPGESGASFMMKGAIEFLLGNSREAKALRRNFVFKIIPMLNPDGVVYGNSRCSLLGVDLNRRWKSPSRLVHPEVFYTKRLITVFSEQHETAVYVDMHGHSAKKDVFMYGCNCPDTLSNQSRSNVLIRTLPIVLGLKNDLFEFSSCHFRLEPSKAATARIVLFEELEILGSYTLEASFFGSRENPRLESTGGHLSAKHLEELGRDLCICLRMYTNRIVFAKQFSKARAYLKERAVKLPLPQLDQEEQHVLQRSEEGDTPRDHSRERPKEDSEKSKDESDELVDTQQPALAQADDLRESRDTPQAKEQENCEDGKGYVEAVNDVEGRLRRLMFESAKNAGVQPREHTPAPTDLSDQTPPKAEEDALQGATLISELLEEMSDAAQEEFKQQESESDSGGSGAEASDDEKADEITPSVVKYRPRKRLASTFHKTPSSSRTNKNLTDRSFVNKSAKSPRPTTTDFTAPIPLANPKIIIRARLIPSFIPNPVLNRTPQRSRENPQREYLKPKLVFCPSRGESVSRSTTQATGRRLSNHTRL